MKQPGKDKISCFRLLISGHVQGVYYRASCRSEAMRLGVKGWVRNAPDGRVEAVVEGAPEAVERLISWCRWGPALAHVTGLETVAREPSGFEDFRVIR